MTVNETAETYTARILSFLGGREPLPILSSTAARLRQFIEGRTREEISSLWISLTVPMILLPVSTRPP